MSLFLTSINCLSVKPFGSEVSVVNAHSEPAHCAEPLTPYEPESTLRSSKALLPLRLPGAP